MSFLKRVFGNAFASQSSSEMSEEELQQEQELFDRIAKEVVSRGLTAPAILFLEMHQPFSYMAGQLAHSLGPFASILVDEQNTRAFARALCRREGIERLVRAIEDEDRKQNSNGTQDDYDTQNDYDTNAGEREV
mgnify:FL=1